MEFFIEPGKQIPIRSVVDVLVIGSGPAGVSAAINSGRQGVKTLLVEQMGSVGGISTVGLMSHWTGNSKGGFYEEILARAQDHKKKWGRRIGSRVTINPEKLKRVYLDMLHEASVELLLYTMAVAPILEDNRITGVLIESKSGREAIKAKIIIDATGDGDIAARSGVPYTKGRNTDHKMQPVTLMFKVGNVKPTFWRLPGSFESNFLVPRGKIQDLAKKHLPHPAGHVLLYKSTLPGIYTVNMTNVIDIDGTEVADLTKAELIARRQIPQILAFLRKFVPGFQRCIHISSASLLGVRETRHFQGEYRLTESDILEAKYFEDWVVKNAHFNFDIHNLEGSGLDKEGVQKKFAQKQGYTIPYGCFIPQKIDNLFLVGRNIAGTHKAHSNFRVMPICANMGHAVGIAAALCINNKVTPRELNPKLVQSALGKEL